MASEEEDNYELSMPPKKKIKESSREDRFAQLLTNEDYHDLMLQGTDGVLVGANRAALAASSDVFHKMLYGNFKESSLKTVPVNYNGVVANAIVEYIGKGTASLLDSTTSEEVEHLVALTDAALYFDIPLLCHDAFNSIKNLLEKEPILSLKVLEVCVEQDYLNIPSEVKILALSNLPEKMNLQDADVVQELSPNILEEIVKDKNSSFTEMQLFELIQKWAIDDRKSMASALTKYIKLHKIHPQELSTTITASGLVTSEQLAEAYKFHALRAAPMGITYDIPRRCKTIWKEAKSKDFEWCGTKRSYNTDYFDVKPLSYGKYMWVIEIRKLWKCFLGIKFFLQKESIGRHWGLMSTGAIVKMKALKNAGSPNESRAYKEGSQVKFTLDLTDPTSETLSASVDGGKGFIISKLMRYRHDDTPSNQRGGFVPIARMYCCEEGHNNCIRIVDFRKL